MSKRRFVAIGDMVADMYYSGDKLIRSDGGGERFNVIANLANMGRETAIIGGCGNDEVGRMVLQRTNSLGVDTSKVKWRDRPIRAYHLTMDQAMFPKYIYECSPISPLDYQNNWYDDNEDDLEEYESYVDSSDIVILDKLDDFSMHIIDHFDCDKVIDIGNTKYLERLSDDDIRALRGKLSIVQFNERVIPYMLQRFQLRNPSELYDMLRPQMMIITRGRNGADFWYENGSTKKELVNSTEEIDPTGAGDAFFSVFIKGFFDNSKQVDSDFIDRTFDEASLLTSEVVKNIGARGHIPEKRLEKRPGPMRKTKVSFPDNSVHEYEILQESVSYKSETEGYVIRNLESSRKGYLKHASFVRRERNGRIKFKDRNVSNYGEVVSKRIADKVGISACDAEVGYIQERAKDKSRTIPVAISYFDLQEAEQMVPAASIIEWFKLNYEREAREDVLGGNFSEFDWETKRVNCNIPLILTAFDRYLADMTSASEEDRKKLRQDIIDMIVFDCKFGNTDRHDDNFGLGVSNDGSGKVRFYPLFDNEAVLGFNTPDSYVRKCKDDYSRLHSNRLWSLLNFGTDFYRPADIASVERELFERYPEETTNAYQKVMRLSAEKLEEILGDYPELSSDNPKRHDYIMSTFELLDKKMRQSYEEYTQGLNQRDLDSDAEDGGDQR